MNSASALTIRAVEPIIKPNALPVQTDPSGDSSMRIILKVTAGPHVGRDFFLEGHDVFLVGRARQAHFHLPKKDLRISRGHCMIEANFPPCRLRDMDSRNGTFVNGQKVKTADIRDGDEIRVGRTILQVAVETTGPTPVTECSSGNCT